MGGVTVLRSGKAVSGACVSGLGVSRGVWDVWTLFFPRTIETPEILVAK